MAMEIKRFIRKIIFTNKCEALLIQLNPTIADFIKSSYLRVWQDEFGTKIFIASAPDFAWEKYRVEIQGDLKAVEYRARQLEAL